MVKMDIEEAWLNRMEKLNKYNEWLFAHIKNYLGNSVWEAGAGIGTYSIYMIHVKLLILSDIVDDYLSKLRIKFNKFDNILIEKIDLVNDDYKKLKPYDIDTVVCVNTLKHVKADIKAIENIYDVLTEGGKFLFIGPHHPFLYGSLDRYANHYRRYTKAQLVSALRQIGFKIEKIFIINFLATFNWFFQSRVLRRKIISEKNLIQCEKFIELAKFIDSINPFPIGSNIVLIAKK